MSEMARGWASAIFVIVGVMTILALGPGCQRSPFDDKRFMRLEVDRDRVREVDTLDLETRERAREVDPEEVDIDAYARHLQDPDDPLPLTIDACRAIALEHNLDLKVELVNPLIAAEQVSEEEARFEALFFSNINYANTDSPTSSTLSGSQTESLSVEPGFELPLRTGGSVSVSVPMNQFETNNIFSTLNPAYATDLAISLSQPLLRNAGVRANTNAIRIARYSSYAAQARTKLQLIQVLTAVDRVYWRLYAARRELEVRKDEYDLAVAQRERAQRRVNAGDAAEVEVIRAEAAVAERVEGIILAENAVRDRERDLKRIMNRPGLDLGSSTIIVPSTEPTPVRYAVEARALAEAALEQRMEMLELQIQLAQDDSQIAFARNQVLPLVDFTYSYNINGLGPTWNDSFDLLVDNRFEDHVFGLQVRIPLGNEAAESRFRQAVLQRLQRYATREQRATAIRQEVFNAVDQLEANWQRVLASRQAVLAAQRELSAEERQFELGLRVSTDVLDAQSRFANAQLAFIRAITEYEIARVDIAFATGTVLGASRVQWAPAPPEIEVDYGRAVREVIN
ncbi:MAG: TolC family protein [Phycisphaerales bacterium]